jgi:two-component system, chemotaxis family, sensor kinase CheA
VSNNTEDNNLFADFLDDYFAESEEHLAIIRRNLLAIEPFVQQPEIERTLVDELFRSFHSIKGLSGMVGVKEAEQVAHEMESYLRALRDKQVFLTSEGLDALMSGTKMLDLVVATHRQQNPLPDVTSVIKQLTAVLASDSSPENGQEVTHEDIEEQSVQTESVTPVVEEPNLDPESAASEVQEQTETISSDSIALDLPNLAHLTLKPEESKRLAAALQNGTQAWRFVFIPEPALSQRGINVNNIRQRLQSIGEIVHASPQVIANGGIAFNFVVTTQADAATFVLWREDGLACIPYVEEAVAASEAEVRSQESEVRSQESGVRSQESGVRSQESGVRSQESGVRSQELQVAPQDSKVPTQELQVAPQDSKVVTQDSGLRTQETPPVPLSNSPPASSNFVRVDLTRLDELMQMVGELVITRARLGDNLKALKGSVPEPQLRPLREANLTLERQLRDLREGVMRVRLVPIGEIFARMQFVIRDIARESNKQIALELSGQNTEIDKFVVERMMDPLLHLVRNAVSHGLESEAERIAEGKSPQGKITLRAATSGEMVVIEIEDDGRGVDVDKVAQRARSQALIAADATPDMATILDILCSSGFSTRDQADLTSGRGVGMAVVKNTVQELGGFLNLHTQVGLGTRFTIQLPLTLAIADALTVSLSGQTFAVPQSSVREVLELQPQSITVLENNEIFPHRGNVLPLLRLAHLFKLAPLSPETRNGKHLHVVVVGSGLNAVGLLVDRIIGQREIVVRPLTDPLVQVVGIAGATELGDGRVVLILDTAALLKVARVATWKVTRLSSLPLR